MDISGSEVLVCCDVAHRLCWPYGVDVGGHVVVMDVSSVCTVFWWPAIAGRCDAERIRDGGQCPGETCQALPASDLRHYSVAVEQQVSQSASAGG